MLTRDVSKLLWCELENDEERVEFLRIGRAYDTGIIAHAIVEDVMLAFEYRLNHRWREVIDK